MIESLFGAVAQTVMSFLGRTIFRRLQKPERRNDILRHDREIFARLDAIISEPEIDYMCNAELFNGRLSREKGSKADQLHHFLEMEGSRFATRRLGRREEALAERLMPVLEFTALKFFTADQWSGWVLHPELKQIGREREYRELLAEIQVKSGDLWKAYLELRKAVKDVLIV